jgi:hypothetical protein
LKEHYEPTNWMRVSQETIKGTITHAYHFNKTGLRVEGIIISRHSGYIVIVDLWAPMTKLNEPTTSVFGSFEFL